jgi:uncharacterized protein YdeI (BOF family)
MAPPLPGLKRSSEPAASTGGGFLKRSLSLKTLIALAVIVVAIISGCTENYGQPMKGNLPRLTVITAMTDPAYLNKGIILEGTILSQCQASGCWFFLEDHTGRILVDLAPNNFTLTMNKVSRKVTVKGTLAKAESQIKLIGKEVTIH